MGRKNKNVRRSNDRKRLHREKTAALPKRDRHARVDVERMVTPAGKCYFQTWNGLDIYPTPAIARRALEQVQAQRRFSGSGRIEKRFFECPEGGCGGYHLTSREEYDGNNLSPKGREA